MDILLWLNREEGVTLVMVTHDRGLAGKLGRRLHVQDGQIIEPENGS
jgi:putative ABC transport system ATP-binding protein